MLDKYYVRPRRDIGRSLDEYGARYGALLGAYVMLEQEARVYRGRYPEIARAHATQCRRLVAVFGRRDDSLWDVEIPYYDLAGDDELFHHLVTIRGKDEATAIDRAEASLRARVPSAHILSERVTCRAAASPTIPSPEGR